MDFILIVILKINLIFCLLLQLMKFYQHICNINFFIFIYSFLIDIFNLKQNDRKLSEKNFFDIKSIILLNQKIYLFTNFH